MGRVVWVTCALLLAATPARAEDEPSVFAWPGAAGGMVVTPNSVGFTPTLSMSWRPWSFLEPEILVATGPFVGLNDLKQRFSFGSRLVLPNPGGLRPFLWAAFTHAHETPFETVASDPVLATLGFSEAGVEHRSGGELGVGMLLPFTISRYHGEEQTIDVLVRLNALYLPDFAAEAVTDKPGDHLYTMIELAVGLPLSFDPDALQPPRIGPVALKR